MQQLRLFSCFVVFLAASFAFAADDEATSLTRGPYVQSSTPSSIVVVWRTDGPTKPAVRFGASPDRLDRSTTADDVAVRGTKDEPDGTAFTGLHSAPDGTLQYEARLDGLSADTTYYYAVYDGKTKLAGGDDDHYFRTHPTAGTKQPFRV
jgi:hypothetical protein